MERHVNLVGGPLCGMDVQWPDGNTRVCAYKQPLTNRPAQYQLEGDFEVMEVGSVGKKILGATAFWVDGMQSA